MSKIISNQAITMCEVCNQEEWETKLEDENDDKIYVCGSCFIFLTQE